MKNRITVIATILVVLACPALAPVAQATPPPKPENRGNGNSAAENVQALNFGTTGSNNTAHGWFSLFNNTTGSSNTADGFQALYINTEGADNTAYGVQALYSNGGSLSEQAGSSNTAIGYQALYSNSGHSFRTASFNTAIGNQALYNNTIGAENTANGGDALISNTDGSDYTACGFQALYSNTIGVHNTAVGAFALSANTGSLNTAIGTGAGSGVTTANNVICIGAFLAGSNVDNSCFIGNIYSNVQPVVGTDPDYVTINSGGRLGRGNVSSRRYKHDIKPMDKASETIFALKPVSFRYDKQYDPTQTLAFGLIAEEVAEVDPNLVGRNPAGEPESVRYEQINAMLLNEFLKEHKKVEAHESKIDQQQATIAELKQGLQLLTAQLKEQAAQIQKVSAQIEISRPAPRTVLNNR